MESYVLLILGIAVTWLSITMMRRPDSIYSAYKWYSQFCLPDPEGSRRSRLSNPLVVQADGSRLLIIGLIALCGAIIRIYRHV